MRSVPLSIQTRTWLLLGGIFLLGLALRLYRLDTHGLWGDEVSSIQGARLGLPGIFTQRFGWIGNQTPLHYLIIWIANQLSDPASTPIFVRLPSAIAGALALLAAYGLGSVMFGRVQGLLAALMLALSPVYLNYSQEARPYSILVALTAIAVYCLIKAEASGAPRWWALFAIAQSLNILNSFFAMTLVLPALVPYIAWLLWRQWQQRREGNKTWIYPLLSLSLIALVCIPMLLDMARTPRTPIDLGHLSWSAPFSAILEMSSWLTQFGIGGQAERIFQAAFLLLAILGLYSALRSNTAARKYALLAVSLTVIPPTMLAVIGSSNEVFQRYAIFSMPFYYLLVANGVALLTATAYKARGHGGRVIQLAMVSGAITLILLSIYPFAIGALNYFNPEKTYDLSYRPDFRGAAAYLADHAHPADLIIFVDDPPLGYNVTQFYWRQKPPAPTFDARDPRLFAQPTRGSIYWVMASDDAQVTQRIVTPDQGWADISRLEGVVIMREAPGGVSITASFEHLVDKLNIIHPGYQSFLLLRACAQQARGDIAGAAATYRAAGPYFLLAAEYLRTSRGFLSIGEPQNAWQEALSAKAMQPYLPETHNWLSQRLLYDGYPTESRVETEVEAALRP